MLTQEEWATKEAELEMLTAKRDALKAEVAEISSQIRYLSATIRNHKRRVEADEQVKAESFVHQMFGKSLKDLTPKERRIYNSARQNAINEKKKEHLI